MNSKTEDIAALYVAEHKRLERQITRHIGCAATARDLVQDIFLRLWERTAGRLSEPAPYLTRSARNATIDHVRAEKRRGELLNDLLLSEQYNTLPPCPDDVIAARQTLRGIDDVLAALPERTRHIFLLNRVHGRSFSEIAEALGISRRAVTKHMARAVAACDSAA